MIKKKTLETLVKGDKIKIEYADSICNATIIANDPIDRIIFMRIGGWLYGHDTFRNYGDYNFKHFKMLN